VTQNDGKSNWPTPGPNGPIPSWLKYEQLRETIHDYLDHEPDDPKWNDGWMPLNRRTTSGSTSSSSPSKGLEVSILGKSWYNLGSTGRLLLA